MVRFPQPQNGPAGLPPPSAPQPEPQNAFCAMPQFSQFMNPKKMEKMAGKMQHKMMKNMTRNLSNNPEQSAEYLKHMNQHFASLGKVTKCTMDNQSGDVEMHVDIPIHHSDGTTTCSKTVTTTNTVNQEEEPLLNQQVNEPGFEDLSIEANDARLNEAVEKMAELGFNGEWVKELLKSYNCDISRAVEAMNPSK